MTIIQGSARDWGEHPYASEQPYAGEQPYGETPSYSESPFAETWAEQEQQSPDSTEAIGYLPWTESLSPFGQEGLSGPVDFAQTQLDEAFEAVRDEAFDEALSDLLAETEDAVTQRFAEESPVPAIERQRIGDAHLAPIQLAAESYVDSLIEGVSGLAVEGLEERQLDEVLDRFDPSPSGISPAGEEFVRALAKKAKGITKFVAGAAKAVGKVASVALGPVLQKLKKLIRPLLKRVLSFAIGRLPAPLQAPARLLSKKLLGESEYGYEQEFEDEDETEVDLRAESEDLASTPSIPIDPLSLAESFDAALAEFMTSPDALNGEMEAFASEYEDEFQAVEGTAELEQLAEARSRLMDTIAHARDGEDLTPAIEQFVPALLPALRVGIRLAGRPRVVKFLAGYLARLIGRWVGPQLAQPLSSAIVDTGLRLVTLEQAEPETETEAVPAMLASTIEDTVRTLAEAEDYMLEDEDLMQLATAEAFERAVATNFPSSLVRPKARRAPSVGGRFVPRRPRSARPYRKLSRIHDIELTERAAARIRTFGNVTLAAALRAAGATFPLKGRLHVYQATTGTTLRTIAKHERARGGSRLSSSHLHPLTPLAASILVRDPSLGVAVAGRFLRSRDRVAAGQRFFYIESVATAPSTQRRRAPQPTQGWIVVDTIKARITLAFYFSETDAQQVAEGIRQGRGAAVMLPLLTSLYDGLANSFNNSGGRVRILKEREEGEEFAGALVNRLMPLVRKALVHVIRKWLLPLVTEWLRKRAAEFTRETANPAEGVTVTVQFTNVPGMGLLRQALNGTLGLSSLRNLAKGSVFSGVPNGSVTVKAGVRKP